MLFLVIVDPSGDLLAHGWPLSLKLGVATSSYDPRSAFELILQWSVSTGAVISDLIYGWARRSQQCGFSLIPVPHDPFAMPITKNSDPVRSPIFVPLNKDCLMEYKLKLFKAFAEDRWESNSSAPWYSGLVLKYLSWACSALRYQKILRALICPTAQKT